MGTGRPEDQALPVPNDYPYVQNLMQTHLDRMILHSADDGYREAVTLLKTSLEERRALGEKRYGVPGLQPHNGRDMLRDAFEEVLDAAVYMRAQCWESLGGEDEETSEADYECYVTLMREAVYLRGRIARRDRG